MTPVRNIIARPARGSTCARDYDPQARYLGQELFLIGNIHSEYAWGPRQQFLGVGVAKRGQHPQARLRPLAHALGDRVDALSKPTNLKTKSADSSGG